MIEPALSDESFLEAVARGYQDSPRVYLWWLGQSGFLLTWMEDYLVIDPYLSDSLTEKYGATDKPHLRMCRRVVDPAALTNVYVILSTHNHTDHLDAQTLKPMIERSDWPQVIAPAANLDVVADRTGLAVKDLWGIDDGTEVVISGFRVHGVAAAHETVERDERGRCKFLGYILRMNKFTLYHSGDTVLYDRLVERLLPFNVDVAILPINGRAPERRVAGNLNGIEAARLAKDINARLVIPCHYDMFEFNTADPYAEFVPECERINQRYRVLQLGERWSSEELGLPTKSTTPTV